MADPETKNQPVKKHTGKHVSIRLSDAEAAVVEKMGGVTKAFRKWLNEQVLNSENVNAMIQEKKKRMEEAEKERDKLSREIESHNAEYSALKELEKQFLKRSKPKFDLLSPEPKLIPSRLPKKRRPASKVTSRRDWEQGFKVYYLILHALTGDLPDADQRTIIHRLQLKPPVTPLEWIYGPSPEVIPLNTLEVYRTDKRSKEHNLQNLKERGLINPRFYELLMKWLSMKSKEEVDSWIAEGCPAGSTTDVSTEQSVQSPMPPHDDQPHAATPIAPGAEVCREQGGISDSILLKIATASHEQYRKPEEVNKS
jgi:hypothetical protein